MNPTSGREDKMYV